MILVVGLGNVGAEYENTYHNMGFMAVDTLAARLGLDLKHAECSALTDVTQKGGEKIILAKPTTYMNLSGVAVKSLMAKYGVNVTEVIVMYDDIDIHRFTVRARADGSGGTHNGMKNVLSVVGREDVKRIRLGVGKSEGELRDFVLGKVKSADRADFQEMFDRVADELLQYIADKDFERMQRELNKK